MHEPPTPTQMIVADDGQRVTCPHCQAANPEHTRLCHTCAREMGQTFTCSLCNRRTRWTGECIQGVVSAYEPKTPMFAHMVPQLIYVLCPKCSHKRRTGKGDERRQTVEQIQKNVRGRYEAKK